MSVFDRLDRLASRTVDRVNKIRFILTPMARTPNGRPSEDPGREPVDGYGIFDSLSVEFGLQLGVRKSYREGNDLRTNQVGRDPQISVDRRYFSSGWIPKQGDVVSFPDNDDLPDFDVVSSEPDGLSRIVLRLLQQGAQT
ncbi:conserved hypothetical protein [uncultured Pleomorphomonas sp.]|uniref:Uncharacterized protein n=1 Tax=uncultured Pleomorphomonas sp. TaxID=442121 RepID=A0A212LQU2_9HYPH|nr:hypothetical protein [uncultured Pleomorphomonas sp.]SCM79965.1 conserved hypothetical protein [uncultured Pleomorphomonas sp.]